MVGSCTTPTACNAASRKAAMSSVTKRGRWGIGAGRTPCEAGKGTQVGRDERVRQSLQHGRSSYQALRTFRQHLHYEIAFLQRREARPGRRIEAFADHVDGPWLLNHLAMHYS
jgi:hypothetical protein